MPPIELTSHGFTACIAPFGAELASLRDPQGREYLWQADPAIWPRHAPNLFPMVGRLNGDLLRHGGQTYPMKQHGFARDGTFEVMETGDDFVRLRLCDSQETRARYPFAFELEVAYRLEGGRLQVGYSVCNPGTEPLPVSLGGHPAFAWSLPDGGARSDHVVVFGQHEPGPIHRLSGGLLNPTALPTPVQDDRLPLSDDLFADDALIWTQLASRKVALVSPNGAQVAVTFDDFPMLGIWSKPGAHFVCLEPWQGHADTVGFAGDFADKPGVALVAPGEERRWIMHIAVTP